MTEDQSRLAFGHQTQIVKYRDGEDEPYETVDGERVWTESDGTVITDPDRIAQLEAKAKETA